MRKTPFLLSLLLLASCSSGQAQESESKTVELPESEVSSVQEEKIYWDKRTDALLQETIGEAIASLPVYDSPSYEAVNIDDEDTGLTYTAIYCLSDNVVGNEAKLYSLALIAQGFAKAGDGESITLYKEATDTDYLVVTLYQGESGGNTSVVLYTYLSTFRYKEWPSEVIEGYLGFDVPSYPGDYYYLATSAGALQIQVEGATESSPSEYSSMLEFNDYKIQSTEYSGYTVYYATPTDGSHTITYAYDSDTSILLIQVSLASY